ncbi:MAG: hypothetical protein HWE26_16395 [Alteromonadaceae bacterium]|nr:hypothetical protein [Alteromonadaceae bacterium]
MDGERYSNVAEVIYEAIELTRCHGGVAFPGIYRSALNFPAARYGLPSLNKNRSFETPALADLQVFKIYLILAGTGYPGACVCERVVHGGIFDSSPVTDLIEVVAGTGIRNIDLRIKQSDWFAPTSLRQPQGLAPDKPAARTLATSLDFFLRLASKVQAPRKALVNAACVCLVGFLAGRLPPLTSPTDAIGG